MSKCPHCGESNDEAVARRVADWIGDFAFAYGEDSLPNVIYEIETALRNGRWKLPLPRDPETGEPIPHESSPPDPG